MIIFINLSKIDDVVLNWNVLYDYDVGREKSQKETSKLIDVIKKTAGQRGALGASPVDAFTSQIVKRQKDRRKKIKDMNTIIMNKKNETNIIDLS